MTLHSSHQNSSVWRTVPTFWSDVHINVHSYFTWADVPVCGHTCSIYTFNYLVHILASVCYTVEICTCVFHPSLSTHYFHFGIYWNWRMFVT